MIDACRPAALHQSGNPQPKTENTAIRQPRHVRSPLGSSDHRVSALASVAVLSCVTVHIERTDQRPQQDETGPQINTPRMAK